MNKTGTVTLETNRLMLRRFTPEDAGDMYRNWACDSEVTRFLTWPPHKSEEVTSGLLAEWIGKYGDGLYFNWAIELKETGSVIGNISVVHLDEKVLSAEIGYCLGRAYWGRGLMTEALKAVLDHIFDEVQLNRAAAYHDVRNTASGRVMEKAGMLKEGTLRQAKLNNSGICDVTYRSMLRSDRDSR